MAEVEKRCKSPEALRMAVNAAARRDARGSAVAASAFIKVDADSSVGDVEENEQLELKERASISYVLDPYGLVAQQIAIRNCV